MTKTKFSDVKLSLRYLNARLLNECPANAGQYIRQFYYSVKWEMSTIRNIHVYNFSLQPHRYNYNFQRNKGDSKSIERYN